MDREAKPRSAEADNRLVLIGLMCLAALIGLIIITTVVIAGGISE